MQVIRRDPYRGYMDRYLWVPRTAINVEATKSALTHRMVDRTTKQEQVLTLYKESPYHLLVPRAFWDPGMFPFEVVDCRPQHYPYIDFVSKVQLDHRIQLGPSGNHELLPTGKIVQQLSFDALSASMGGVLQLGCGQGKTATFLHYIASQRVPALVLLDNSQLLHQWQEEVESLLVVPGGVGVIAKGKKDWQKGLVLGTYLSVANWVDSMPEEVRRWFGIVCWDEGHHLSAPIFSKTAAAFYGRRFLLTATPERSDGYHIIADLHVGKVLHKDLSQPLQARFIMQWTNLGLDLTDSQVQKAVLDKKKEIHMSKVNQYLGSWRARLNMVITHAQQAVAAGRRLLVLANSVDEVVNLMAIWTYGPSAPLLTDIQYPQPADVGETLTPLPLDPNEATKLENSILKAEKDYNRAFTQNPYTVEANNLLGTLQMLQGEWAKYQVYKKCEALHGKLRKDYIKQLIDAPSTAGFMVFGVPAAKRQMFVKTRHVTFAIMKYGKEGLDAPHLDTVGISSAFSDRNALQQIMGRITGRPMPGKKSCLVYFYRDDIGPVHGMLEKIEKHLRDWPADAGGPQNVEHIGNPTRMHWQKVPDLATAFNQ